MLPDALAQVDATHVVWRRRRLVYFGGSDYLRLARHPEVVAAASAAARRFGVGLGASRKTTGNHPLFLRLERALARFFDVEAALLVPTGYSTNLMVAQGFAGDATHVLMDERAHATLRDAAALLGAPQVLFRHRDAGDLARRLAKLPARAHPWVLTDGTFGHDGAVAPLDRYLRVLPRGGTLLVDDCHGTGTLGRRGRGAVELCGVRDPRVLVSTTLSKALGAFGGVILGRRRALERITGSSRLLAGSTAFPPLLAAAALAALRVLRRNADLRARLFRSTLAVKRPLLAAGVLSEITPGPVVYVAPRTVAQAERLRLRLLDRGVFPSFIRYPGGPSGGYFRFALSSAHDSEQLAALVDAVAGAR